MCVLCVCWGRGREGIWKWVKKGHMYAVTHGWQEKVLNKTFYSILFTLFQYYSPLFRDTRNLHSYFWSYWWWRVSFVVLRRKCSVTEICSIVSFLGSTVKASNLYESLWHCDWLLPFWIGCLQLNSLLYGSRANYFCPLPFGLISASFSMSPFINVSAAWSSFRPVMSCKSYSTACGSVRAKLFSWRQFQGWVDAAHNCVKLSSTVWIWSCGPSNQIWINISKMIRLISLWWSGILRLLVKHYF